MLFCTGNGKMNTQPILVRSSSDAHVILGYSWFINARLLIWRFLGLKMPRATHIDDTRYFSSAYHWSLFDFDDYASAGSVNTAQYGYKMIIFLWYYILILLYNYAEGNIIIIMVDVSHFGLYVASKYLPISLHYFSCHDHD